MSRKISDDQFLQHIKSCSEGMEIFKKLATANKPLEFDDFHTIMLAGGIDCFYDLEDLIHSGYVVKKETIISHEFPLREFSISKKGKKLYNEFLRKDIL